MQIVVLGAGKVGASLAEHLVEEDHDVTVIDSDAERLKNLQSRLDLKTFVGYASHPSVLKEAGTAEADMLIGVTDQDEVNMVACMIAYSLFKTPIKIARVHSGYYFARKELLSDENVAIDLLISPERLVIDYIKAIIDHPGAFKVIPFAEGRVTLIGVKPFYGGHLFGKSLDRIQEILPGVKFEIAAIFRDGQPLPLAGSTTIEIGDEVYFIAGSEYVEMVMGAFRPSDEVNQKIMIAGGGNIGSGLAKALEYDYQVKLIDRDQKQCEMLSQTLGNTTVLMSNATDPDFLRSENVEEMDVFCGLTDNGEVNVISCMQAKHLGARQTIALMTKPSYTELIHGKEINIAVSPEQATVSSILAYIRGGSIVSAHSLEEDVEVIEMLAKGGEESSPVIGKAIEEIDLPEGTAISLIIREDEVIIPEEDVVIAENDHVIIFVSDTKNVQQLGELFKNEIE